MKKILPILMLGFISFAFAEGPVLDDTNRVPQIPRDKVGNFIPEKDPGLDAIVKPGAEFGMRDGDIIQAVDGKRVKDVLEGFTQINQRGEKIKEITVLRNGKVVKLKKKALETR